MGKFIRKINACQVHIGSFRIFFEASNYFGGSVQDKAPCSIIQMARNCTLTDKEPWNGQYLRGSVLSERFLNSLWRHSLCTLPPHSISRAIRNPRDTPSSCTSGNLAVFAGSISARKAPDVPSTPLYSTSLRFANCRTLIPRP